MLSISAEIPPAHLQNTTLYFATCGIVVWVNGYFWCPYSPLLSRISAKLAPYTITTDWAKSSQRWLPTQLSRRYVLTAIQ